MSSKFRTPEDLPASQHCLQHSRSLHLLYLVAFHDVSIKDDEIGLFARDQGSSPGLLAEGERAVDRHHLNGRLKNYSFQVYIYPMARV